VIIYQDSHLLAVNKPFNLTVNRSETTRNEDTIFDIIDRLGVLTASPESLEFTDRHGVVHRLDKDTSGILLIARDPDAFAVLQTQFKSREVQKEYLALVHGQFDESERHFTIDAPIGRNPRNRFKNAVVETGRPAQTSFNFVGRGTKPLPTTLLKAFPHTGRTHQIRVHLAAINHPVCGDDTYSPRNLYREYVNFLESKNIPVRMFLHAARITFTHPVTGKQMTLEAPLPAELQQVLSVIGIKLVET